MGGFSAFWAGYPHPPISRKLTRERGAVSSERFVGIRPPLPSGVCPPGPAAQGPPPGGRRPRSAAGGPPPGGPLPGSAAPGSARRGPPSGSAAESAAPGGPSAQGPPPGVRPPEVRRRGPPRPGGFCAKGRPRGGGPWGPTRVYRKPFFGRRGFVLTHQRLRQTLVVRSGGLFAGRSELWVAPGTAPGPRAGKAARPKDHHRGFTLAEKGKAAAAFCAAATTLTLEVRAAGRRPKGRPPRRRGPFRETKAEAARAAQAAREIAARAENLLDEYTPT